MRYAADPPRVEEIIAVMRQAGTGTHADRVRGLIAVLWRAGLRITEALMLTESDLDARSGSVLVRCGKGGMRRLVGMDDWGWEHVNTWTNVGSRSSRAAVLDPGWPHPRTSVVSDRRSRRATVPRRSGRCAPQVRTPPTTSRSRGRDGPRGIALPVIQRQLGHAHLGITSIYLQGIDTSEIINTVHDRRPPVIPASAGVNM